MIKYYEFTEQEILDIRSYLPNDIAFGFLNYGHWFVSETEVNNIDGSHGKIIDLAIESVFSDTRENVLNEKESTEFETYINQKQKDSDGFDAYEKIVGFMDTNDGLGTSLDNEIIPSYIELTNVRMMLKDGLFIPALRYLNTTIKDLNVITQETLDYSNEVITELSLSYGKSQEEITAVINAPKGVI